MELTAGRICGLHTAAMTKRTLHTHNLFLLQTTREYSRVLFDLKKAYKLLSGLQGSTELHTLGFIVREVCVNTLFTRH